MIQIKGLVKKFNDTVALKGLNCEIQNGTIFGLVGSNGSGKSTLLRTLSGVYRADEGEILIDGEPVLDNPEIKSRCYFVSDYPFFGNKDTLDGLADMVKSLYKNWSDTTYHKLCEVFPINRNGKIINMSKGQQRQAALILAFSTRPKYLFMDEIFDGLDPMIRMQLKKLIIENVTDNNMTCIIASHNLREIDDICDNMVMLNSGELLINQEVDELKSKLNKIQVAFENNPGDSVFDDLDVQILNHYGNYYMLMVHGDIEVIEKHLRSLKPAFIEVLPSTLEEIFISKMEEVGYGKH